MTGVPGRCGGTSVLAEDFTSYDSQEPWNPSESGGASVDLDNGELVVHLPDGSADSSDAYIETSRYFDLRDDAISVEMTNPGNTESTTYAYLVVSLGGSDYIEITQYKGSLAFARTQQGTTTTLKSIPYDPVLHRYLRIREAEGVTYWETSSDGETFTSQASLSSALIFPLQLVRVVLGAGTDGGTTNPGEPRFDRLNGGGAPRGKWCPIASLVDDFNDGVQAPIWERSWEDVDGMLRENGGALELALVEGSEEYASYQAAPGFDLGGSALTVEVPLVQDAASKASAGVFLEGREGQEIDMVYEEGSLHFTIESGGVESNVGSIAYSPVDHRWWRVREEGGALHWETSPNGKTFTERASLSPLPFPVHSLDVNLGGGTWTAQPAPGMARFDNLNLPPR